MLFGDRRHAVTGMGYGMSLTLVSLYVHCCFLNLGRTGYCLSVKNALVQRHVQRQIHWVRKIVHCCWELCHVCWSRDSSYWMMMYLGICLSRLDCSLMNAQMGCLEQVKRYQAKSQIQRLQRAYHQNRWGDSYFPFLSVHEAARDATFFSLHLSILSAISWVL